MSRRLGTPAALSNTLYFSHTPRQVGRGGGTGLLISNNWKYSTHSPLCNYNSNQIKSLLLSHHHSTSALMSEILMSVLQTVQKKPNNLHMDRQCKKTTNNLHMDRQCKKKQQTIYIWTDSAKKLHWSIYSAPDSAKKQQQFTYGQYIFTDCTEDNVQNTHTYTQYT